MENPMKVKSVKRDILEFIMIVAFILNEFANIVSFYLTRNTNETLRKIISWGIMFFVVIVLFLYFVRVYLFPKSENRKMILLASIPLIINGIVLMWALLKYSGNVVVIREFISFTVYCIPMLCVATYIVIENRLQSVVEKAIYVSLAILPYYLVAIFYFWKLSIETDDGNGFGGIGYLGIGYSAVTLYTFLLVCLLFIGRQYKDKKLRIGLSIFEMCVCSLIVVFSGSRGVLLAWLVSNATAIVLMILKKIYFPLIAIIFCILALLGCIICAPVNNAGITRQFSIVAELKKGALNEALTSEEGDKVVEIIKENANNGIGMKDTVTEIQGLEYDNSTETDTSFEQNDIENENVSKDIMLSITNGSMARAYLFQLALIEAKEAPITGLGPMGYQMKYKTYPHNIFFEALADFGIVIGLSFCIACALLATIVLKKARHDLLWGGLLLLLCPQVVRYLLSGDLYVAPFLIFCVALICLYKGVTCKTNKTVDNNKEC